MSKIRAKSVAGLFKSKPFKHSTRQTPLQEWAGLQMGKIVNGKKVVRVTCWTNGRGVWLWLEDGTKIAKVKP